MDDCRSFVRTCRSFFHRTFGYVSNHLVGLYHFIHKMDPRFQLSTEELDQILNEDMRLSNLVDESKAAREIDEANSYKAKICEAVIRINKEPLLVSYASRVKYHITRISAEYDRIKSRRLKLAGPLSRQSSTRHLEYDPEDISPFTGGDIFVVLESSCDSASSYFGGHSGGQEFRAMNLSRTMP